MHAALWIGDVELPEFAPAAGVLRRRFRLSVVRQAVDALRVEPTADWTVVFVAEALPGERWSPDFDELRRRRPNLPIVRLIGPGCDGELRSHPPATVPRYRWLEAPAELERDCDLLERDECPSWGRPVTQGPEERLLEAADAVPDLPTSAVVSSHDPATAAWLVDALRAAGARAVIFGESRPAASQTAVVLWQVPDDRSAAEAELRRLRDCLPHAEFVALVGFPRVEQAARLQAWGVRRVVALPAAPGAVVRAVAEAAVAAQAKQV